MVSAHLCQGGHVRYISGIIQNWVCVDIFIGAEEMFLVDFCQKDIIWRIDLIFIIITEITRDIYLQYKC